jgi:hypothetical protein
VNRKPFPQRRRVPPWARLCLAAALTVTPCFNAVAAALWCQGTVSNFWIDSGGTAYVYTSWRGGYVQICNVNQPITAASPTACLSWLALLRSAVERQSTTLIFYPAAPVATCAEMPTYQYAPEPSYVMMVN